MRLPNAEWAQIDKEKITAYLLAEDQSQSRGKSGFFSSFGFRADQWEVLAEALAIQGASHEVSEVEETRFGPRYSVEGVLNTPDGRNPLVRTVWQFDRGYNYPRFITAHPFRR